jgi:hypothetical protein
VRPSRRSSAGNLTPACFRGAQCCVYPTRSLFPRRSRCSCYCRVVVPSSMLLGKALLPSRAGPRRASQSSNKGRSIRVLTAPGM